jgi:hypothetical protein
VVKSRKEIDAGRNYAKEAAYEDTPRQVKRREQRNLRRRQATKKYGKKALEGKQLDHIGYHPLGDLKGVPAVVVSTHRNESRQPPHKAKWYRNHKKGK